MKKTVFVLVAVVAVIIAVMAFGVREKEQATVINIACFPNITHAQALLMKERGVLESAFGRDVVVNWRVFNAGPSEIEAMFAGDIDLGYIGPVPAVSGYTKSKGDLRIIAGVSNGGAVLLARKGAGINNASALNGKIVAVPQLGNTQHLSLLALLKQNGLVPVANGGTVDVRAVANADVANLMEQGNIDAALVPEPWGSIMELNGSAMVALDYDKIDVNGVPNTAVVIVRKDFLDANRNAVKTFMQAHKEATVYINEHRAEATALINRQIDTLTKKAIDPAVLERSFSRLDINFAIPGESVLDFAKISAENGFIETVPNENIFDESFIE